MKKEIVMEKLGLEQFKAQIDNVARENKECQYKLITASFLYYKNLIEQNKKESIFVCSGDQVKKITIECTENIMILDYLKNIEKGMQETTGFYKNDVNTSDLVVAYGKLSRKINVQGTKLLAEVISLDQNQIEIVYHYDATKYTESAVKHLHAYISCIYQFIENNRDKRIHDIEFLNQTQKELMIHTFNKNDASYDRSKTMIQTFTETAEKYPDRIAIEYKEEKLSYSTFNKKANYLGKYLLNQGIKNDEVVAIITERSIEMMVGIFGTLKAGGAYLPISPDTPLERIEFILKDSNTKTLLVGPGVEALNLANASFLEGISIIYLQDMIENEEENFENSATPESLAYIIYTSGTTGNPKGVMIQNNNLLNLLTWMQQDGFTEKEVVLLKTTYAFDLSIWEVFLWCTCGAKLVILPPDDEYDLRKLSEAISNYGITRTSFVPSVLEEFLPHIGEAQLRSLKKIQLSGEALPVDLANRFNKVCKGKAALINSYGPTECTVFSTSYKIPTQEEQVDMHIGKPLQQTKIYILNRNRLCGVGMIGEIVIGGSGVARGYLNNQALTDEKFKKDPFTKNQWVYQTGDLGKWREDGTIEYLGRMDDQVKIRGHRIELKEIESQIKAIDDIQNAVVIPVEKEGFKNIHAYFTSEKLFNSDEIKNQLRKKLPDYMIPTHIIKIDKMPVTKNGKLDKKALLKIEIDRVSEYVAPRDLWEEKMVHLFEEVLVVTDVGIHDRFMETGGDSLKAIRLLNRISKEFNIQLPIRTLLECQTVEELATLIKNSESTVEYEPIVRNNLDEYPMSSAQKNLFLFGQINPDSIVYNIPFVYKTTQKMNLDRLEASIQKLLTKHEILRTKFSVKDGEYMQTVQKNSLFRLEVKDISSDGIKTAMDSFVRPFSFNEDSLIRICVFRSTKNYYVAFDIHHIIYDEGSEKTLIKEINKYYLEDDENSENNESSQFIDYCNWRNNENNQDKRLYWKRQFEKEMPVVNVRTDYPRPKSQSNRGENVHSILNEDLKEEITRFSKAMGVTEYMVLLSSFLLLLQKYTRQNDIVVGTPMAGRAHQDAENMIGMFVNTVPIQLEFEGCSSYLDLLSAVKEKCLDAYVNQEYPYEELLGNRSRDTSRNPLFDMMFVLQNNEVEDLQLGDATFTKLSYYKAVSTFDLTVSVVNDEKGRYGIQWEYCTDLFKKETIERLSEHYATIVKNSIQAPEKKLSDITYIEKKEYDEIIYKFNDTKKPYSESKTIVELFEEQVAKVPDNIAVSFKDEQLTYRELNEKANTLAHYLRENGVKPDDVVGILCDKSIENVVSVYGVIKSGAAYMPIITNCPSKRLEYLVKNSKCRYLIKGPGCTLDLEKIQGVTVMDMSTFSSDATENLPLVNKSHDLAYVIYTSGSTGEPKGVMVEHRNVINLATWQADCGMYQEGSIMVHRTAFVFDGHVWEMFSAGLSGIRLEIVDEESGKDLALVAQSLADKQMALIPSMFSMLLNYLEAKQSSTVVEVDKLYLAAEAIPRGMVEKYKKYINPDLSKLYNLYGPTECTVTATSYRFSEREAELAEYPPIGKPIYNTQIYIMNDNELCGIGVPGELCIGGAGVVRGYLNNPDLTEEKFVINPHTNERIYRTGDLAYWLADGNIQYIGRIDDQIKFKGIRIEISEIENTLRKIPQVLDAVVTVNGEANNENLCAYLIAEDISETKVRKILVEKLPPYMIPTFIMKLEEFPRTASGKLDKKSLPMPQLSEDINYIASRNKTEAIIESLFMELLAVDKVGIYTDFFELGGHSLRAMNLAICLEKEFKKEFTIRDIMTYRTVEQLAAVVNEKPDILEIETIPKVKEQEVYQMSSVQKRLFAITQTEKDNTIYNTPIEIIIKGELSYKRLTEAIEKLCMRHESLRTRFISINGDWVQKIDKEVTISIPVKRVKEENVAEECVAFIRPFDLGEERLIRAKILQLSPKEHILLLDIHHIVCDGSSLKIILDDISAYYNEKTLPELEVQYKDISDWSSKREQKEQETYWLSQFLEQPQPLELYLDYTRPQKRSYKGKNFDCTVSTELMEKIKVICQQKGVTEASFFLTTFMILLSKYSLMEEIVIGIPVEGRSHPQMQNVVGMFVNTLLIKADVKKMDSFQVFLSEIQDQFLRALENQEYLFEDLVDNISTSLDPSRNPIFDVMFAFQNNEQSPFQLSNCETKVVNQKNTAAKFDLLLEVIESKENYQLTWEYATDLFKEETIYHMGRHFINLLEDVTEHVEINIKALSMNGVEDVNSTKLLCQNPNLTTTETLTQRKTILAYFDEQVRTKRDCLAVWYNEKAISYGELNKKANQLARTILVRGVEKEERIAVSAEKTVEALIAILAILKAGCAYLPIDMKSPVSRINYMLEDSSCRLLLKGQTAVPDTINQNIQQIDLFEEEAYHSDTSEPNVEVSPDQLAYVIYTSGTTGEPKGVMIEHKSIIRLVKTNSYIDFKNIKIIPTGAMSFDASTFEIWGPLLNGGEIFLINEKDITDVEKMEKALTSHGINTLWLTVSLFNQFIDLKKELFQGLRYLLIGGEQLSEYHVEKFLDCNQKTELINGYGPTECTTFALTYSFKQGMRSPIPIGRPINQTEVYIMQDGILCGTNVPGELYLGGEGVARGYQNRSELTVEKFSSNPFGEGKIYATGDIARLTEDGYVEFLGRKDSQVKIRGFRIELGEIETQIKTLSAVQDAIVVVKTEKQEDYIAAYIIEKEHIEIQDIQEQLRESLPEYFIPRKIMKLKQFPLTGNGKLDVRALPEIEYQRKAIEQPQSIYEEHVLRAFVDVFDSDEIGTEMDFFELGGHSLRAAKLVNYIGEYSGIHLTVGSVMKEKTIKKIAKVLKEQGSNSQPGFVEMMAITEEEI